MEDQLNTLFEDLSIYKVVIPVELLVAVFFNKYGCKNMLYVNKVTRRGILRKYIVIDVARLCGVALKQN